VLSLDKEEKKNGKKQLTLEYFTFDILDVKQLLNILMIWYLYLGRSVHTK